MSLIDTLIDKQDNLEIIRDKIALILANNSVEQQNLAVAESKDPDLWKLRVFTERINVFEGLLNARPEDDPDLSPMINVSFEDGFVNLSNSDIVKEQEHQTRYLIHCFGFGYAETNGSGQTTSDEQAAFEAQRAARLVRNILMASVNTYLDLRGIVGMRWVDRMQMLRPDSENRTLNAIVCQIDFVVRHSEFSPQYTPQTLCILNTQIQRALDGQVLAEVELDFT